MLILIHGDDSVASRKKLSEILDSHPDYQIVRLNGKTLDEEQFVTAALSQSLFAEKKLIIIESLLGDLRIKVKQHLVSRVADPSITHTVVVWEDKTIEKTTRTKYFAQAKDYHCALPAQLFTFLDSVGRESGARLVTVFHALVRHEDPLLILGMLLRQWRYLVLAQDLGLGGFPSYQQWQAQKYFSQARYFSPDKLVASYRQLLAIDYKIKTGQTPMNTTQLIDMFLLTL